MLNVDLWMRFLHSYREKQKIESPNNRKQKTGDFQIGIKNGRRNSRREVQRNERNGRNRDEKNKNQSNRNQKNKDLNNRSKSQSNENNYLIVYNGLKIISVICTFQAVILEGIFVFYGMRSGFTRQLFQYSVGGMLLIIVFACGFIWSAQTVRKIKQKNKYSKQFHHKKLKTVVQPEPFHRLVHPNLSPQPPDKAT